MKRTPFDRVSMIKSERGRADRQNPDRSRDGGTGPRLKKVTDGDKTHEVLQRAKRRAELRLWTVERELGVAESLIAVGTLPNARKVVEYAQSELDSVRRDTEKENRGEPDSAEDSKSIAAKKDADIKIQLLYNRMEQLQKQILVQEAADDARLGSQFTVLHGSVLPGWSPEIGDDRRDMSPQRDSLPKRSSSQPPASAPTTKLPSAVNERDLALALLNDALDTPKVSQQVLPAQSALSSGVDAPRSDSAVSSLPNAASPSPYPATSPRWVGVDVGDLVGDEELRALCSQRQLERLEANTKDGREVPASAPISLTQEAPDWTAARQCAGGAEHRAQGWWALGHTLSKVGAVMEEAITTVLAPSASASPSESPTSSPSAPTRDGGSRVLHTAPGAQPGGAPAATGTDLRAPTASSSTSAVDVESASQSAAPGGSVGRPRQLPRPPLTTTVAAAAAPVGGGEKGARGRSDMRGGLLEGEGDGEEGARERERVLGGGLLGTRAGAESVPSTAGERAIAAARRRGQEEAAEAGAGWIAQMLTQHLVSMEVPVEWREGQHYRTGLPESEYSAGEMVVVQRGRAGGVFGCVQRVHAAGQGVEVRVEGANGGGLGSAGGVCRRMEGAMLGKIVAEGVWGGKAGKSVGECSKGAAQASALQAAGSGSAKAAGPPREWEEARLEGMVSEWGCQRGKLVPALWREGSEWVRGIGNAFAVGDVVVVSAGEAGPARGLLGVVASVNVEEWTADIDVGAQGTMEGVGLAKLGKIKVVGAWEGYVGRRVLHAGARSVVIAGEGGDGHGVAIKVQRRGGRAGREGRVLEWVRGQGAAGARHVVALEGKLLWGKGGEVGQGLVLEMAVGSLQRSLQGECGGWSWEQVRDVMAGVGGALAWLHERGMAHMDVRPATVLLFTAMGRDTWKLGGMDHAGWQGEEEEERGRAAGSEGSGAASVWADPESSRGRAAGQRGCVTSERDVWGFGMLLAVLSAEDPSRGEEELMRRSVGGREGEGGAAAWEGVALPPAVPRLRHGAAALVLHRALTARPREKMAALLREELWREGGAGEAQGARGAGAQAAVDGEEEVGSTADPGDGGAEGAGQASAVQAALCCEGQGVGGASGRGGLERRTGESPRLQRSVNRSLQLSPVVEEASPLSSATRSPVESLEAGAGEHIEPWCADAGAGSGVDGGAGGREAAEGEVGAAPESNAAVPAREIVAAQPAAEEGAAVGEAAVEEEAGGAAGEGGRAGDGGEWQEVVDEESGATYFWDTATGETAWELPAGQKAAAAAVAPLEREEAAVVPCAGALSPHGAEAEAVGAAAEEEGAVSPERSGGEHSGDDGSESCVSEAGGQVLGWTVGAWEEAGTAAAAAGAGGAAGMGQGAECGGGATGGEEGGGGGRGGGANPAVRELVESEQRYVARLEGLVGGVLEPLRSSHDTLAPLMAEDDMDQVFGNVEEILRLNRMLAGEMAQRLQQHAPPPHATARGTPPRALPVAVGDILWRFVPHLHLYKRYVSRLDSACRRLRKLQHGSSELAAFLAEEGRGGVEQVESLLAEPFQRVLRYRLLLGSLVRFANAGSREHEELLRALRSVEETLADLNEARRQREARDNLRRVQRQLSRRNLTGARTRCVRQGEVWARGPGGELAARQLYLLESGVLCSERVEGAGEHAGPPAVEVLRRVEGARKEESGQCRAGADAGGHGSAGKEWMAFWGEGAEMVVGAAGGEERAAWLAAVEEVVAGMQGAGGGRGQSERRGWGGARAAAAAAVAVAVALLVLVAMGAWVARGGVAWRECGGGDGRPGCRLSGAIASQPAAHGEEQRQRGWRVAGFAQRHGEDGARGGGVQGEARMPEHDRDGEARRGADTGRGIGGRFAKVGKGVVGAGRRAVEKVGTWVGTRRGGGADL